MHSMYAQFDSSQLSDQTLDEVRQAREAQFAEIKDAQQKIALQQRDLDIMIKKATDVSLLTTTESQPARSSTDALPAGFIARPAEPRAIFTGTWSGKTGEWHQRRRRSLEATNAHITIHITGCSRSSESSCRCTISLK